MGNCNVPHIYCCVLRERRGDSGVAAIKYFAHECLAGVIVSDEGRASDKAGEDTHKLELIVCFGVVPELLLGEVLALWIVVE